MADTTIKIFIASSLELQADRDQFRLFITDENARLNASGIFLELVCFENFANAISDDGLQAEYNKALCASDMAVFLIFSKAGKFTVQEFDAAVSAYRDNKKPKIWTYFKNEALYPESIREDEIASLFAFKQKIRDMKHYRTSYVNIYDLKYQFKVQLELTYPELFAIVKTAPQTNDTVEKTAVINTPDKNIFNEILGSRLFEAIKGKNARADELFENGKMNGVSWKDDADYRNLAKDIIASAYGVLGTLLRKLMAIGLQDASAEKQENYVSTCHLTALRALQLLCFSMLSKLWDEKEKNYTYSADQLKLLSNFFGTYEINIFGYTKLLTCLLGIYSEKQLDYPIAEMKDLAEKMQTDNSFITACNGLHTAITSGFTEDDRLKAETDLTIILEQLSFLVNYSLQSIKNIEYFGLRNIKKYYVHNYTALGLEENSNIDQVKNDDAPLNTYAVLLKNNKIDYYPKLNLFPFIIDANALASEKGAKIYFYASSSKDGSLNYSLWEDRDNKTTIHQPDSGLPGDITSAKFNAKRSAEVLTLFGDARQAIAPPDTATIAKTTA